MAQQVQVIGVDLWDDQRHVGHHAVVRSVGEHQQAGLGEGRLGLRRGFVGQRAEDRPHLRRKPPHGLWVGGQQHHLAHLGRHLALHHPMRGFRIALALAAIRRGQRGDAKERMSAEQLDEAHPNRASGAQDSDGDFVGNHARKMIPQTMTRA